MKYLDLFGGVGGFRLGLERAGDFKCVGYCDNNRWSVGVYNFRFNESYAPTDARDLNDVPRFDLLCAGFPCQPFSYAGKRRGLAEPRGNLFLEIVRLVKAEKPPYLLLENVRGLLSNSGGEAFKVIIETLGSVGYDVQWMVLDSKLFGVPQGRERVFIIGSLRESSLPRILPFRESLFRPQGVLRQAEAGDPLMVFRGHVRANIRRRVRTIHDNPSWCLGGCETILVDPKNLRFRRLTPIEHERLQGFPPEFTKWALIDDKIIEVPPWERTRMMIQAVTVNVVKAIGQKLASAIISLPLSVN